VLVSVTATALLYLLVATEARHQIATAQRTERAVGSIDLAQKSAKNAARALRNTFDQGDVTLTGTGTEFANDTAQVNSEITSAAEFNAAGAEGARQIQFVQGQLTTCVQLAESAVNDYAHLGGSADEAALGALTGRDEQREDTGADIADTGGLIAALGDLRDLEQNALDAQLGSFWLAPGYVWALLMMPVVVMLLLFMETGRVLVRHFRRYQSPLLAGSLLTAVVTAGAVCVVSTYDERHWSVDPWAGQPATMAVVLSLLAAGAVLAYLAYRPRLDEYRFPRP